MTKQATELRYAVRFRVVFKYFGQLCLVLAALTLVPLVVSLIFGDVSISLRYGMVIFGLAALGAGLARLKTPARVQANEGMVLVALMFLFTPIVMSYPMMDSGLGFLDALFEAVSGVTTTGLSTKTTLVGAPQTFLFARAWMQWYGGLGVVVLSLALIMQPGLVAKGLAVTEAESDDLVGGTRAYARRALIFAMLVGGGAGSTAGGFKLLRLLIAASVFRLILLRTCLPKHAVIEPRLADRCLQDEEIQAALLLIVLFVAVVAMSWLPFVAMGYSPLDSLFEVVSATGTAGLSVGLTSATLPPLLKGILCVDMLMERLEIMAWLVMLYPGTWFGRRMEVT